MLFYIYAILVYTIEKEKWNMSRAAFEHGPSKREWKRR